MCLNEELELKEIIRYNSTKLSCIHMTTFEGLRFIILDIKYKMLVIIIESKLLLFLESGEVLLLFAKSVACCGIVYCDK